MRSSSLVDPVIAHAPCAVYRVFLLGWVTARSRLSRAVALRRTFSSSLRPHTIVGGGTDRPFVRALASDACGLTRLSSHRYILPRVAPAALSRLAPVRGRSVLAQNICHCGTKGRVHRCGEIISTEVRPPRKRKKNGAWKSKKRTVLRPGQIDAGEVALGQKRGGVDFDAMSTWCLIRCAHPAAAPSMRRGSEG